MDVSRRHFLKGAAAGTAGTALASGVLIGGARADADAATATTTARSFPFHGTHQAGVLTPGPAGKQAFACFAGFDIMAGGQAGLADLMRALTSRARILTAGGAAPDLGVGQPPSDSDVLGPAVPADGLTVTLSAGSSLFDDRYGLAALKPARLTPMRAFPDDSPDPAWLHGDLLLQLCADHPDTIHHAIRDITRHTRGGMQVRWKIEGYNSPPRPSGTSRNLLGFKDGAANPAGAEASRLVWVDDPAERSEPAWARGGSYQVVRLIRMLVEFWDRVSINEQEGMFGRRRDTGAPLDGSSESDTPDYAADPHGQVIPWTRTSGWPTPVPGRPPASGSCAAPTTTTSASTPTATWRPGTSSSPTSKTSAGSSRRSRHGWPASRSSTTSSRSAAATSSPCPASGTPPTGTAGPS